MTETSVTFRTCPLCEATCGLAITTRGGEVESVRGDDADVFSKGYICPKGVSIKELHEDPDRLRTPMLKQADGTFRAATWDEAFAEIARRLPPLLATDRNSVAVYLGNPSAHHIAPMIYGRVLIKALGTNNVYSASTLDQYPKQMASAYMFGSGLSVPVPDLDRTSYLLILGANPLASNGSLMTAPDVKSRLKGIQERGGKIVVFDPRRSRTAKLADEHFFIRPGSDALALLAIVHTLFAEGLVDVGDTQQWLKGLDTVREAAIPYSPDVVADACGIPADDLRRLARELAAAPSAAVYGRIGTTTQEFGTVASWLIDVVNVLTGNLDRPGGAMWSMAAAGAANTKGTPGKGRGARFARYTSRVRELPETFGEFPAATLADEIVTEGEGQVRALITLAGNPVVSSPNSDRLDVALNMLDFMVSVDIYINETTRHADVILPAPSPLERSHYDLALYALSVRNIANYSPPVFDRPEGMLDEWETLLRLTGVAAGQGADAPIGMLDDVVAAEAVRLETATEGSALYGRDPAEILAELAPRVGPERILDLQLRAGPYGDRFGTRDGLTLAQLEAEPHGIDLGPLQPRLPEVLRTKDGLIDLAPEQIVADVARLQGLLTRENSMVLVGRRDLRSNNSWMHNLPVLVKGKQRCTVHVHPSDASRIGLVDGGSAKVSSRAGTVQIPVEVTEDVMPGVVSIPHGWGHDLPGIEMSVASNHAGTNSNVLADELLLEPLTGTAVLNGIPVDLAPA